MADKVTATTTKVAEPVVTTVAAPKTKVANTVVSVVAAPLPVKSIAPTAPPVVVAVTTRVAPGGDTVQPAAIGKAIYH